MGSVIWITGLSGSGKTTLSRALAPKFIKDPVLLDGDEMRGALSLLASGYSYEDRKKLAFTYASLCRTIALQGHIVVCSTISMFHEVHAWNRANLPGYCEIYIEASEEIRKARDYKKVYGEENCLSSPCNHVVGCDLAPELPKCPDILLTQRGQSVEDLVLELCKSPLQNLLK